MLGLSIRKKFAQVLPLYFPISESNYQLECVTIAVCLKLFLNLSIARIGTVI